MSDIKYGWRQEEVSIHGLNNMIFCDIFLIPNIVLQFRFSQIFRNKFMKGPGWRKMCRLLMPILLQLTVGCMKAPGEMGFYDGPVWAARFRSPKGDDDDSKRMELIETLGALTKSLSSWTRNRLEARHSGGKGILLEDALILGKALSRIPGPGIPLPLDVDDYPLPAFEDIEGLTKEVDVLKRRIILPNAGGVR